MAQIDETINAGESSAVVSPSGTMALGVIHTPSGGSVSLMVKASTLPWKMVFSGSGAFTVLTPDATATYKFYSEDADGAEVYLS